MPASSHRPVVTPASSHPASVSASFLCQNALYEEQKTPKHSVSVTVVVKNQVDK